MNQSNNNYVKCQKCGITRNIKEAPDCPICNDAKAPKAEQDKKGEDAPAAED